MWEPHRGGKCQLWVDSSVVRKLSFWEERKPRARWAIWRKESAWSWSPTTGFPSSEALQAQPVKPPIHALDRVSLATILILALGIPVLLVGFCAMSPGLSGSQLRAMPILDWVSGVPFGSFHPLGFCTRALSPPSSLPRPTYHNHRSPSDCKPTLSSQLLRFSNYDAYSHAKKYDEFDKVAR